MGKAFNKHRATLIGLSALGMWAIEPLLVSEINRLPIFELLAILFMSSFVLTAIRITLKGKWQEVLKQPGYVWPIGVIGICASDFAYIFGTKYAPIAHVELIDYLWPSFAIFFTSLLPGELLKKRYLYGAILGFAGIYCLVHTELFADQFNVSFGIGYSFALIGAAIWGGYCAFSRYHKNLPIEVVGLYCGIGSIICLGLHLKFETFVMPTQSELGFTVLTGMTGAGMAYQLWDYGVKFGNVYLLSVLTYLARLAGLSLLVLFGKEPLSRELVMACLLATAGVIVSTTGLRALNPLLLWTRIRYRSKLHLEDSPAS